MEVETSKIKGRSVVDSRGNRLGNVDDVVFDPETWSVESLIVSLDRQVADDLNVKHSLVGGARLAVSRGRVSTVGDAVILNVDRDALAGLLRQADASR